MTHLRDGFALGAVIAAEWIISKKGVFSMHDVLFSSLDLTARSRG